MDLYVSAVFNGSAHALFNPLAWGDFLITNFDQAKKEERKLFFPSSFVSNESVSGPIWRFGTNSKKAEIYEGILKENKLVSNVHLVSLKIVCGIVVLQIIHLPFRKVEKSKRLKLFY